MDPTSQHPGVRADPKFLRGPTSLESISSGISRISSYVTSNLPKRKINLSAYISQDPQLQQFMQQQQQQQLLQQDLTMKSSTPDTERETESVTFAAFEKLDTKSSRTTYLLLGYQGGFQLWDVSNPDNIHEVCSVRDDEALSLVTFVHIVTSPQDEKTDKYAESRPLLAVVSKKEVRPVDESTEENNLLHTRLASTGSLTGQTQTTTHLYSLKTNTFIDVIPPLEDDEEAMNVTGVKSNSRVIIMGCTTLKRSTLHLFSNTDFTHLIPLTDVFHDPTSGPTFTLGTRFLAYATSAPVLNSDPSLASIRHGGISTTGIRVLNGEKDMKGAAKDIAKEMVNGVKSLSEIGYQTISNYFNAQSYQDHSSSYVASPASPLRPSTVPTLSGNRRFDGFERTIPSPTASGSKKQMPSGMIMLRDTLKIPLSKSQSLSSSTIAHFRPHLHPVTCLAFNSAGTLLMSVSKQGHTFHVFAIMPSGGHLGNAAHLYSLSRGYTDAQVEDCQFSVDSTWCAVSTARGTTHIYAINPYGGNPDINGHVNGKVNNMPYHPLSVPKLTKVLSLESVSRIKQRHVMPSSSEPVTDEQHQLATNINAMTLGYHTMPSMMRHGAMSPTLPTSSLTGSKNLGSRAKLVTTFLSTTKMPYLLNCVSDANGSNRPNGSNAQTPLETFRNQASNLGTMLSNLGSTVANSPLSSYLPHQTRPHTWTATKDKTNDVRLFEFDEEELILDDDSAKIINDATGYQDMYSFHPNGILTLHRCWVTKTISKRREHGRSVERLGLTVKPEDIAEWNVARGADWEQVTMSLDIDAHSAGTPVSAPATETPEDRPITSSKKRGRSHRRKEETETVRPSKKPTSVWLSNAEITTFAVPSDEPPLWANIHFRFQTFKAPSAAELERTLQSGIVPTTDTLVVRKEIPEPYASRVDRVGKTKARQENQTEENLDDALAELEENISSAMETSFSPSSIMSSLGGSPAGIMRLSSSVGATPSGTQGASSSPSSGFVRSSPLDQESSLSFEDAYLISMGGAPGLDTAYDGSADYLTHRPEPPSTEASDSQTLQHSSLIQFDDEHASMFATPAQHDVLRFEESSSSSGASSVWAQQPVMPPDGDNEIDFPADSIFDA